MEAASYEICAVILIAIIIFSYYSKRNISNFQNKLFIAMSWTVLISSLSDAIYLSFPSMELVPKWILEMFNYIYFISHNTTPFFFAYYVIALTNTQWNMKRGVTLLLKIPLLVDYVMIGLTPFFKLVFFFDDQHVYNRNTGLIVLYCIAAYYMAFGLIYAWIYKKIIHWRTRIGLVLFVVISVCCVFVQLINPRLIIEAFGISICLLLIYLTIQKQEELVEGYTGVLNKNAFLQSLVTNFYVESRFSIAAVMIEDLNFLTNSLGISNVHNLLKTVADYFLGLVKKKGEVYHIEENCFCIIFNEEDRDNIEREIKIIQKRFMDSWKYGDSVIKLFIRICLLHCPEDAENVENVIDYFDGLSKKSNNGRKRVLYAEDLNITFKKRSDYIERAVKKAIQENTMEVYYQPIYSVTEQKLISAEALIRLYDPQLGYISPDEFIPLAEKSGDILKIGKFVLESVCRFISKNKLKEKGIQYIEVNLSVVECMQDNLVEQTTQILDRFQVMPGQINLEITETAAVNSPEILSINMKRLSDIGIHFSMDDYGSGYSSLINIVKLPFQLLKLDKSIVWSYFENRKAAIVMENVISMARELGMEIVAEGVETREQALKLSDIGCEYLQGYYFSKPVPAREFLRIITQGSQGNSIENGGE